MLNSILETYCKFVINDIIKYGKNKLRNNNKEN